MSDAQIRRVYLAGFRYGSSFSRGDVVRTNGVPRSVQMRCTASVHGFVFGLSVNITCIIDMRAERQHMNKLHA